MSTISRLEPTWDTSSFGHPADISNQERSALGDHLSLCSALRGPLQALQTGGDALQGLVAGHVITSLLVLGLLVGVSWLMF